MERIYGEMEIGGKIEGGWIGPEKTQAVFIDRSGVFGSVGGECGFGSD